MLYFIQTYGCQMNEYDSDRLANTIESLGYKKTDSYQNADLVIINTCSIREKAAAKVYSQLGRIWEIKKEMLKSGRYMIIAITGCVPEIEKEKIFKRAKYVDIAIGPQSYHKMKEMILQIKNSLEINKKGVLTPKITHLSHLEFDTVDKFDFLNEERQNFNGVSAFISIQEGCNKFCTYCVVPNTRGREISRKPEEILNEVSKVVSLGAREIILLGQNVNGYHGKDNSEKNWSLADLIKEISKNEQILRIRYTTSHPKDVTDELIKAHKEIDKLVPHLHLPVQSGSNEILKKMNRKYTIESYLEILEKFKQAKSNIVFSSDFIVGFPNESEEDFQKTIELIEKVNFQAQCFSYKYSKRPNTVASLILDEISEERKNQRLYKLQNLLEKQRMNFNNSFLNKELLVLFDNKDMKNPLQISGRSQYMQLVIVNCRSENEKNLFYGKEILVKIIKIQANIIFGVVVGFD